MSCNSHWYTCQMWYLVNYDSHWYTCQMWYLVNDSHWYTCQMWYLVNYNWLIHMSNVISGQLRLSLIHMSNVISGQLRLSLIHILNVISGQLRLSLIHMLNVISGQLRSNLTSPGKEVTQTWDTTISHNHKAQQTRDPTISHNHKAQQSICSVCHNDNLVLSSSTTYHLIFNVNNLMGGTTGASTANLSTIPEFTTSFQFSLCRSIFRVFFV
jgi:hypothetical protein